MHGLDGLSLLIKPLIWISWGCDSVLLSLHAKLFTLQCSSWEICVSFHLLHFCIGDLISDAIIDQPGFKNHYYLLQYIDHLSLENRSHIRCLTPSLRIASSSGNFCLQSHEQGPVPLSLPSLGKQDAVVLLSTACIHLALQPSKPNQRKRKKEKAVKADFLKLCYLCYQPVINVVVIGDNS